MTDDEVRNYIAMIAEDLSGFVRDAVVRKVEGDLWKSAMDSGWEDAIDRTSRHLINDEDADTPLNAWRRPLVALMARIKVTVDAVSSDTITVRVSLGD
jgi:hypothetical protein